MKILSDDQIHIKSERIIKMSENYDIEEAVEDNWRISLLECVSCRTKLIWENYIVEMTDEEKFFRESEEIYEHLPISVSSVRNRFHILMPKSDLIDRKNDPLQESILHLLDRYELNILELVNDETVTENLKSNFKKTTININSNDYCSALESLCKMTEAYIKHVCKIEGKETFGSLIHYLFPSEDKSETKEKSYKPSLFHQLLDINAKFTSIKHQNIESMIVDISSDFIVFTLLTFNELIKFVRNSKANLIT